MNAPRIAILILAHKNPQQLQKLIDHLAKDFDVYVHADRKSDLADKYQHSTPVKRHRVYWGSYNQILATLELFSTAAKKEYDRYILISGQDIPVKTNAEISRFFMDNPGKQFLEFTKVPVPWWNAEGGMERLKYYYLKSDREFFRKVSGKLVDWQKMFPFLGRKVQFTPYAGANWMNLNKEAVQYILAYVKSHPEYLGRFRFTHCADELFFQTILLNSPLADSCENNLLRYFNWKKGPEFPRTLRMDDLEEILQSPALFARKFDETVDNNVIVEMYQRVAST